MAKKHSLIIGGTRGIGRALAKMLFLKGNAVSVIGTRQPADSDKKDPNIKYWIVDISQKEQLGAVLREIVATNGPVNDLVFLQRYRGKDDAWAGEIETSITSTRDIIESLSDKFDKSGAKSIVIVSSVFGRFIANGQALSYHVAKAAMEQIARYYAVTLGPKGFRVNSVSPFTILKDESKDFYLNNKELLGLYEKIVPLGRMGTANEVASVIDFLCSPAASYVNGQNLVIDGGLSLKWQESLARDLLNIK